MSKYNKICEWLEDHSTSGSWDDGWSSNILMYVGKSVVLEWREYGLNKKGQELFDLGYDGFERENKCWDSFMLDCHAHQYTDYNKVVGRSFLTLSRDLWESFLKDYSENKSEWDLTWKHLPLKRVPRSKMVGNTTTI